MDQYLDSINLSLIFLLQRKKFSKFGKPAGTKNKPQPVYDDYEGGRKVDYNDEDDEEGSDRGEW